MKRNEVNEWLLEDSVDFSKGEQWPINIKRSILSKMRREGCCCKMSDIRNKK